MVMRSVTRRVGSCDNKLTAWANEHLPLRLHTGDLKAELGPVEPYSRCRRPKLRKFEVT